MYARNGEQKTSRGNDRRPSRAGAFERFVPNLKFTWLIDPLFHTPLTEFRVSTVLTAVQCFPGEASIFSFPARDGEYSIGRKLSRQPGVIFAGEIRATRARLTSVLPVPGLVCSLVSTRRYFSSAGYRNVYETSAHRVDANGIRRGRRKLSINLNVLPGRTIQWNFPSREGAVGVTSNTEISRV